MHYIDAIKKTKKLYENTSFHTRNKVVGVVHEDGSALWFVNACAIELDEQWVAVITEHNGYYAFSYDDLTHIQMYVSVKIDRWQK